MFWTWLQVMFYVVVAAAIFVPIAIVFDRWMSKRVLARIEKSSCTKCGELLGLQKWNTFETAPGGNHYFRIICGKCGARSIYDQWGVDTEGKYIWNERVWDDRDTPSDD